VKHMRMGRNVTQAFENCERKIGCRQLMREAFTNQPRQLSLMVESVETRHDAAGAVTQHENGLARLSGFYDGHNHLDIPDIVFKRFDIEALAVGISATTQIQGVDG
jgi:hypothetical protein